MAQPLIQRESNHVRSLEQDNSTEGLIYKSGLDRIEEAVISSHFMSELAGNAELRLYSERELAAKSLEIDTEALYRKLIPSLLNACQALCRERAAAARPRATANYRKYGLDSPHDVGIAETITEVMFDRQYLRGPRDYCSRLFLCDKVKERIKSGASIQMAIPALPLKFSSPLKTRGQLPDLGEVGFILGLYEIARTIDLVYRAAKPDLRGGLARFTVVSDGSRFNHVVDEPDSVIDCYRTHLSDWIPRLGLDEYITLLDYRTLLREKLPAADWEMKASIQERARKEYAAALWPVFDPCNVAATLIAAAKVDPDPESSNREGRFVSLLKSLVYTINYKTLRKLAWLSASDYCSLYRDLTKHIFEPFEVLSAFELEHIRQNVDSGEEFAPTKMVKEYLRQSMLREVWNASIDYMAEIKSDRELKEDPILTCLPDHFRWTIHGKSGQLAILTPTALGIAVQAWAGAAVFKLTQKNRIKLCTLPVLALEGAGAIPVRLSRENDALSLGSQPLFYIYPDVTFVNLGDFLCTVSRSLERRRTR